MALTKITPQMFDTSAAGHDFNIDNGTFVVDASANRVGIGTATPSTLLDVNGALTATTIAGTLTTAAQTNITSLGTLSALTVTGTSTLGVVDASSFTDVITNTIYTQSGSLDIDTVLTGRDVTFTQGSTNLMTVKGDASGVGIGTASPAKRLHIFDSTQTNQSVRFGNPAAAPYGEINFNSTGFEHLYIDSHGTTTGYGNIAFRTGPTPDTRMFIHADGHVGIGTTSPKNYTYGDLVIDGVTGSGNASGITLVSTSASYGGIFFADGTTGDERYRGYLQYNHNYSGLTDTFILGTSGATRVTVDGSGNVRIGSGSPSFDFEVNRPTASATALINSGNNDAMLRLYTSNNVGKWRMIARTNDTLSFENLNSGATAFDNRLMITSTGRVGIGTDNPTANLTITDDNAGQATIQARNFATSATGSFGNAHAFEFRAATSTTTHGMLVALNENLSSRRSLEVADSTGIFATFVNGRLGIGRNNPSARLHIQSTGSTTYSGSSAGSNIGLYLTNSESGAAGRTIGIGLTCESNAEVYLNAVTAANNNGGDFVIASRDAGTRAEKMRVHAAGSVTMPKQPYVQGRGNGGWTAFSGSAIWEIQPHGSTPVTSLDRNSDYSTTNKRFTCPVDGVYLVMASWYIYQTAAASAGSQYIHPAVYKNGVLAWNSNMQPYTIVGYEIDRSGTGSKHYDGVQIAFTVYCSEDDYLDIRAYTPNSNTQSYENYHYFSYTLLS